MPSHLFKMPRLTYGSHQIYVKPEFTDGAFTKRAVEVTQGEVKFHLEKLSAKGLAALMRGEKGFWRPSSAKRGINAFQRLSELAQRLVLYRSGIYEYAGNAEVAAPANPCAEDEGAELDLEGAADVVSDVGSEGEGEEEEATHSWQEVDFACRHNNRRKRTKSADIGHIHIAVGVRVVIPEKMEWCSLAGDLGCDIYCVPWGTSKDRPKILTLWGDHPDFAKRLLLIATRENGKTYYAIFDLCMSAMARWLAWSMSGTEAMTVNHYFCRLQLLLTPIAKRYDLSGVVIRFCEGRYNDVLGRERPLDDGMARLSKQALVYLGLWDGVTRVYFAFQFRGIVYSESSDKTALVKGMFAYDSKLDEFGCVMEFPSECRKAWTSGKAAGVTLSLDLVKCTDRCMGRPMLNGSIASMLLLGISMLPASDMGRRLEAKALWERLMEESRDCTKQKMLERAWGLPDKDETPETQELSSVIRPNRYDWWSHETVRAEEIDLLPIDKARRCDPKVETPLTDLVDDTSVESNPECTVGGI